MRLPLHLLLLGVLPLVGLATWPSVAHAQAKQDAQQKADLETLEAAIRDALKGALPGGIPDFEVKATEEGLLISLTDNLNFGMFAVSSAVPRPDLVLVMEKIAKILAARPEPVRAGEFPGVIERRKLLSRIRPVKAAEHDHPVLVSVIDSRMEDSRSRRITLG